MLSFLSPNFNKDFSDETDKTDEKQKDELYAICGWFNYLEKFGPDGGLFQFVFWGNNTYNLEELFFTGDEIQSYDITTREIVFSKLLNEKRISAGYYGMTIFLNEVPILENIPIGASTSLSYEELIFFGDNFPFYRYFFYDGWPPVYVFKDESVREFVTDIRNRNTEKRKEGWDIFINYLRKAGKLIEDNTNIEPIAPQQSDAISIHPNPTTGELRIRNYKLGISDIQIFDIMGKKLLTVDCQPLSVNSIDVSHLPAGIYFVRIKTDKGGVTKKVVKK